VSRKRKIRSVHGLEQRSEPKADGHLCELLTGAEKVIDEKADTHTAGDVIPQVARMDNPRLADSQVLFVKTRNDKSALSWRIIVSDHRDQPDSRVAGRAGLLKTLEREPRHWGRVCPSEVW